MISSKIINRNGHSIVTNAEAERERAIFKELQGNFASQFESVFPDKLAAKSIVIVPSLTLDAEILQKVDGVNYYEERMLCLLMLLRMPFTHLVYVTSMPIDPAIVDYYLHLLPGITSYHARQRLTMLSCFDASCKSLTQKILDRPRLLRRIKNSIPEGHLAHLSCFNVTPAERSLAVKLEMPVYGCDPDIAHIGNKSNSRKIFRACGLATPAGFEDLKTVNDVVDALYNLYVEHPQIRQAVLKLDEGFSGEGNALFSFSGAPSIDDVRCWIESELPKRLKVVAKDVSYRSFIKKFTNEGGIVEMFIDGEIKTSPSVQCRINPLGKIEIISTHDQVLGGESGQVYLGASFPASRDYAGDIGAMTKKVAEELKHYGVLGRFGVDFISVKENDVWKHYAIEINLRKGGTTHPYLMLEFLTSGQYLPEDGLYYMANGQTRYYVCSDNLQSEDYKGITPHDLIDIAMCNDLLYDSSSQEGVMFHLISALSQYGKLGFLCIASSPERANNFYKKTTAVLYREGCGK